MTTDDYVKQQSSETAAAVQALQCTAIQVSHGLSGIHWGKVRSWESYRNYLINNLIL